MSDEDDEQPDLSYIIEPLRDHATPVEALTLDPANANRHPDKNLRAIEDSLREFGQRDVIVARQVGTPVWGLYPVPNPYFMRDAVDIGLRLLDHECMGFVIDERIPRLELFEMHDHAHSIRCWDTFGAVVRLAYFAADTNSFAHEGGWQDHDRKELRREGVQALLERWPELVTPKTHESSGMPDARLKQLGPCTPRDERD